jgi:hypothetical protein
MREKGAIKMSRFLGFYSFFWIKSTQEIRISVRANVQQELNLRKISHQKKSVTTAMKKPDWKKGDPGFTRHGV